ncbi:hypothetical protein UCMB321_0148 [Pseudomonas batumici]|uniref:Uncharacterized protein n=1 Tax=Pseudomonas batumici TaxID=226910 RepID=A0A0C2I948_9PSED|nr:hypothetical protein UCMB321_0148 [Pseudomonas batumici]
MVFAPSRRGLPAPATECLHRFKRPGLALQRRLLGVRRHIQAQSAYFRGAGHGIDIPTCVVKRRHTPSLQASSQACHCRSELARDGSQDTAGYQVSRVIVDVYREQACSYKGACSTFS